jgi:hypothetical protein
MRAQGELMATTAAKTATVGNMTKVKMGLKFGTLGYIGKPFWPELTTLIDIGKQLHPKWGTEKRKQAIQAELDKRGLTLEQYERIQMRAARPFYTNTDADDGGGEVVIPRHILTGMLAQTLNVAPKNAVPKIDRGLLHIGFQIEDGFLRTGKTQKDALVRSYLVKMEESNQRSREEAKYISDFIAEGMLMIDESYFTQEELKAMFEYAGRYVGCGSSRNQGYGRFLLSYWDVAGE